MELSSRARRTISTVLAVLLAVETVSAVAAAATTRTVTHELPADPPAGTVLAAEAEVQAVAPGVLALVQSRPTPGFGAWDDLELLREAASRRQPTAASAPTPADASDKPSGKAKAPKDDKGSKAKASRHKDAAAKAPAKVKRAPVYRGTNHVWIPSLGISRSVRWFPCDRQRPPDNYMYRWGCAGTNNVYLMGHAYSIMKPLHDAYVSGRLRKGMTAFYADARGKVHGYKVIWWRKTLPTTEASWAWAPQSRPSMTLQTCVGRNSQYRLMVRLVRFS
jgi:cell wall-associated NlpC family hydrolase